LGRSLAQEQDADAALRSELGRHDLGWLITSSRTSAGDWDLLAMRPDGSQIRNLTKTPETSEFYPQLTRDGKQLLYRRLAKDEIISGNRYGEQGVPVVARADGTQPRALGVAGDLPWASWSPDGTQVACLAPRGFSIVDVATAKVVRRFPRVGFFQQTIWSPDGKSVVGVANAFGTAWSIAKIDLATAKAAALNRNDCCTPDWSADGRHVIFSWRVPGQETNGGQGWTQLWMTDADGRSPRLLFAEDGRHIYGGRLSPDGRYALFTGNAVEDGDPQSSGAPMQIIRVSDAPMVLGDSPGVRALYPDASAGPVMTLPAGWEPLWTEHELFADAVQQPPSARLGNESLVDSLRSDLTDQGWLAFSAPSERGDWDLYAMRPDGTRRVNLTRTPHFHEMGIRFSPDGKRMLYYRAPADTLVENNNYGTFELVIATQNAASPHSLGTGQMWASWSPDGKRLASLKKDGIHILDAETGRESGETIARQGLVQQLVWAPNGRAFTGTGNGLGPFWNIGVVEVTGSKIVGISDPTRYNCTPDWMPDSNWILYAHGIVGGQSGFAQLWRAASDGSQRELLYAEDNTHIYGGCSSPDGKFLLFTRSTEDLGGQENKRISMSIIRLRDTPLEVHANSTAVPRLELGAGWEPHWTVHELTLE
jgi:Tol biopolymer transport system component